MNNHIKCVEECERIRVATFLVEQFKKEFSRFSIEKELLVELFSRAMRTQQCFIVMDSHAVIGLITYSTPNQASFEMSMKEIKEILGWKSLQFCFDLVQKEKKVGNHQIYINTFTVHPKYRRRGIGTQLLNFLIDEIKGSEYLLDVLSTNKEALRLYQRFGFKINVTKKQKILLKLRLTRTISMKYSSDIR